MKVSAFRVAAFVSSVAIALTLPATVLAAPGGGTDVVKLECGFLSPTTGLQYIEGDGQIKNNPGGKSSASCTGLKLADGQTPVTEIIRTTYAWGPSTCEAVEWPSGAARFNCR